MNSAGTLDLVDPHLSIRECTFCDQVIAVRIPTDPSARMTCEHCERELPLTAAWWAWREAPDVRAHRGDTGSTSESESPLMLTLSHPPPGFTGRATHASLREAWLHAKRAPAPATDPAADARRVAEPYRLVWLASSLSGFALRANDRARARAVLEVALDRTESPSFRVILLARLARLAAYSGASQLARSWLQHMPTNMYVPELIAEARVAEAFVGRAEYGPRGVFDVLVGRDAVQAYPLPMRLLALALLADAHEARGEYAQALGTWHLGSKSFDARFPSYAACYELAPRTRKHVLYRGCLAILLLVASSWAVVVLGRVAISHGPVRLAPLAVLGVALVLALYLRSTRR